MTDAKIDAAPRRSWITSASDSQRSNRLTVHRMTLRDLREHFADRYPDVDVDGLELVNALLYWEDEPTSDELEQRALIRRAHDARHEQWERETYARLHAKFAPVGALEMTD